MTADELRATFDFDVTRIIELLHWTGAVPLYVSQFLSNEEDYERQIMSSVGESLDRLQQSNRDLLGTWGKILDSVY
jgi:hypothetical protein